MPAGIQPGHTPAQRAPSGHRRERRDLVTRDQIARFDIAAPAQESPDFMTDPMRMNGFCDEKLASAAADRAWHKAGCRHHVRLSNQL